MPVVNVDILDLFNHLFDNTHSDLHVVSGHRPYVRDRSGQIRELEDFPVLSEKQVSDAVMAMAGAESWVYFNQHKELDFAYDFRRQKLRVNAYRDVNGVAMALRLIPTKIPTLEEVSLAQEEVKALLRRTKGLVLVTGPTGSGKSTTLAAMIDYINKTQRRHVITIEDPVEFHFDNHMSLINQREVGRHTQDFQKAIRSTLREDPDVIMIGEMRDLETIQAALTLAETGHLVLSTLHTNDAPQAVSRVIGAFPADQQNQVRMQLGAVLSAVFAQTLIPLPEKNGGGKVVARETLINTDAVRATIIENEPRQLYGIIETGRKDGMMLMDQYLGMLLRKGVIDRETFNARVRDRDLANAGTAEAPAPAPAPKPRRSVFSLGDDE